MAKKVAVIVRDREEEALRMSIGLTLDDNEVTVFIMDKKIVSNDSIDLSIETLGELKVKIFSNNSKDKFEHMTTEEIARALTDYEVVIPY